MIQKEWIQMRLLLFWSFNSFFTIDHIFVFDFSFFFFFSFKFPRFLSWYCALNKVFQLIWIAVSLEGKPVTWSVDSGMGSSALVQTSDGSHWANSLIYLRFWPGLGLPCLWNWLVIKFNFSPTPGGNLAMNHQSRSESTQLDAESHTSLSE